MRTQYRSLSVLGLLVGLGLPVMAAQPAQDTIDVVGHAAVSNGTVSRLVATEHYGRLYLYVEHAGDKSVTLMDVTNAGKPKVIGQFNYPQNGRDGLAAVAGTAAVVEDETSTASPGSRRIVKVMSFADAEHPTVEREFKGVTAIGRDNQRGLIFLANADGVWILRQHLAEDPAMVQAYNDYVLYNR